ncbi:hypothetical protein B296_00020338 [Ensete ventricosum]|uniref:Uncharacterized protein n=1 Tax=Ensete ventricosum TaxID=4639 RepID=A0A427B0F2_ENSVE|nr:hypothetical protein B296_00020338 [Ensete ventricosum]
MPHRFSLFHNTIYFHQYIADRNLENNPWYGFEEWSLKKLGMTISTPLCVDRYAYLMLVNSHVIFFRVGLSRERVRQVGLVAMEKLKHVARRRKLEAVLVKH